MDESRAKAEVIEAGNILVERGLVARTWGNVSCRINENLFAVTPSGIGYDRLTPDNIVVVDIHTLEHQGNVKPSSEKGIHADAYRLDPDINFVIHTHQNFASAISVAGFSALDPTEEEIRLFGGRPRHARYGLPGTGKLRRSVRQALRGGGPVLMERHGALLTGTDRDSAFRRAIALEDLCRRAAGKLSASVPVPGAYSRRLKGGFEFSDNGRIQSFSGREEGMRPIERLHSAIYIKYPQFNYIMQMSSLAVETVVESNVKSNAVIPALLDDFAQMVGDAKICQSLSADNVRRTIRHISGALHGRNCVYVHGAGVLCCAADEAGCAALLSLTEKNALACANALSYGRPKPLPYIDRTLQRLVYKFAYSKKYRIPKN